MADACHPDPPVGSEREDPFDPTGWFTPGMVPRTDAERRRKRIGLNVSFLWLAFPVLDLAGSGAGAPRMVLALAGAVAFVAVYNWRCFERSPVAHRWSIVGTLAALVLIAGALSLADRESWSLLFIFVAISGAMRLPHSAAAGWILVCTLLTAVVNLIDDAGADATISLTATTLAIGFMMFAFRRLMDLNVALRAARGEVARLAVSDERLRFARDLHDLVGHSLSVIALKAELAERLVQRDPQRATQHVTEIKDVARDALVEVRETVSGYRRPTLDDELAGARLALDAAGIEAELQAAGAELPADVEAVLAWAVREGTTNVIRHSGASSCRIAVHPGLATASAEIVDDGAARGAAGFNGSAAVAAAPPGNGLAGLRERAEQLAGHVEAGPAQDGGFRLCVTVPLPGQRP